MSNPLNGVRENAAGRLLNIQVFRKKLRFPMPTLISIIDFSPFEL